MKTFHRALLAAFLGITLNLGAADLPELALPQGVGVNIHFTRGHAQDLDMIAAAGFKFIRMDFGWGGTERKKGEYNWAEYDELTASLEKRGLRAIYILDYSNGLYEEAVPEKDSRTGAERKVTASPQHPESVAAFARWAGEAAKHFRGRRIIWEIWNEPNIGFWKPKPDVQQYIALAKATCQAVRANDPQATIIAPASSEFPWAFLEAMFKAGLLEQLDAVSVHPYRNYKRPPESALEEYMRLRALIERYASPAKRGLPIISGEWGYATHDKGVSLETQAAFIVRQQLANLLNGVPLSIWYDWKNDGQDPAYNEHNFGTVTSDLKPKPAYEALQVMTKQLAGYRIVRRLPSLDSNNYAVQDPNDYVVLCVNEAGDQKLVAWTLSEPHEMAMAYGPPRIPRTNSITITDYMNRVLPLKWDRAQLHLHLFNQPQYVSLDIRSVSYTAFSAWKIESPSRSYMAGAKNGLAVTVSVKNPFAYPVTASAALWGSAIRAQGNEHHQFIQLPPGKSTRLTLAITEHQRHLPQTPVTLSMNLRDEANKPIGGFADVLQFTVLNPIELTAAPLEKGLRIHLNAPTGVWFNGAVQAGTEKRSVTLSAITQSAVVDLSGETGEKSIRLLDQSGQLAGETEPRRFQRLDIFSCKAALDGDAKIPASAQIQAAAPPEGNSPGTKIFALDYDCAEGWRFVRCEAETAKPIVFERRPLALGIWVYGDNSGNALRARLRDASGQTFQPNGPNLDWKGWRWVEFDLDDLSKAGHWGGANDGVLKGSLTLDTLLLVDMNRRKTSGRIYFTGPAVVYRAGIRDR